MKLGMVGLGRMGGNMLRRLARGGIAVTGWDRDGETTARYGRELGFDPPASLELLVKRLEPPRVVWLMLPAGTPTGNAIETLRSVLDTGDVVVDGANSNFNDSMARAGRLAGTGVGFVDAGVSGGVWGLEHGYALMVGGEAGYVARVRPFLEVLAPAPDAGWLHCGPAGSGHFVKMVHNGIEYGMMQALAEGFALMQAREDFGLDLAAVAETWRHGSVVRSWLLDLTAEVLTGDPALAEVQPVVADSGEGRWTVVEAVERGVPVPVIAASLMVRQASQGQADYAARLLAMMRNAFGGHAVQREDAG